MSSLIRAAMASICRWQSGDNLLSLSLMHWRRAPPACVPSHNFSSSTIQAGETLLSATALSSGGSADGREAE